MRRLVDAVSAILAEHEARLPPQPPAPPQPAGDAGEYVGTALEDLPGRPDQDGYTVVDKIEAIERARLDQAAARRAYREEIGALTREVERLRVLVRSQEEAVKVSEARMPGKE